MLNTIQVKEMADFSWVRPAPDRPPLFEIHDDSIRKEPDRKTILLRYRPLRDETALYRNFADLPLYNPSALVDWANRYGLLFSRREDSVLGRREWDQARESLSHWWDAVCEVKFVVQLNDLVSRKSRRLSKLVDVRLSGGYRVVAPFDDSMFLKVSGANDLRTIEQRVRYVCTRVVAAALDEHPILMRPTWNDEHNEPELRQTATTLIGAIWYQVAESLTEDSEPISLCSICHKVWFTPIREGHQYCSDACKAQAYRNRKQRNVQGRPTP